MGCISALTYYVLLISGRSAVLYAVGRSICSTAMYEAAMYRCDDARAAVMNRPIIVDLSHHSTAYIGLAQCRACGPLDRLGLASSRTSPKVARIATPQQS